MNLDRVLARGWIPDPLLRLGIRFKVRARYQNQKIKDIEERSRQLRAFIEELKTQPIAIKTERANEQHYELPAGFFEKVLGSRLKYSCGYWDEAVKQGKLSKHLDQAEEQMLELTAERADLRDGQKILELGCGWGSLTLFMAEKFPGSEITAISNSSSQIEYIKEQAGARGLDNLTLKPADINAFRPEEKFDRIVSVEMFEHMRNYQRLFAKVADALQEEGKLFIHIFCHHTYPFLYEDRSGSDWMTRYFFAGGTMPSRDLFSYFSGKLSLEEQWAVAGSHYQKTLEAWLEKMDEEKENIFPIFQETYGETEAGKWWNYWRIFFIASAEFFGYAGGNEWFISHYLFQK